MLRILKTTIVCSRLCTDDSILNHTWAGASLVDRRGAGQWWDYHNRIMADKFTFEIQESKLIEQINLDYEKNFGAGASFPGPAPEKETWIRGMMSGWAPA